MSPRGCVILRRYPQVPSHSSPFLLAAIHLGGCGVEGEFVSGGGGPEVRKSETLQGLRDAAPKVLPASLLPQGQSGGLNKTWGFPISLLDPGLGPSAALWPEP